MCNDLQQMISSEGQCRHSAIEEIHAACENIESRMLKEIALEEVRTEISRRLVP